MTLPGMFHEESIEIEATPAAVYDLVSDLPRMGEWSPENEGGEWVGDGTGEVGDRFLGSNRIGERQWTAMCEITVAERGREFQFVTAPEQGPFVRWSFKTERSGSGTKLTQVWDVESLPPSLVGASEDQIASRITWVQNGMASTLAAMKAAAESR